ncbi:HlyD family efflux transporter periplasmic adaptor subunit [Amycolatopsis acidicola]|uniref:HlyD family efflux transporter periplasmic adaptor subunit n=1 Tax=Amycolatopsis acidicola TaxID=2596893 RepID=A0A5N0US27_9PSEU|nr:HlyD family efflux transporter periplasmic adaptor subunit [Amycolatopsis acidicola]KAA9153707.1 HlyD family efflux transporter periplasmic adaptor subunit [Amycolatopsis acidicola]
MVKRSRVLAVAGAVVVVAGGAVFWATSGSASAGYRTAVAGPAKVTATLDTTGTIEPVQNATVSFPSSGQVASIPVQVGQSVTAGQTLAQLDTTSLASQVASAQSTLATAQAKLANDQTGQSTATSSAGRTTPALFVTTASSTSDLKAQQDAVTSAQHQVDEDLTAASAAVAAQQKACKTIVDASDDKQPEDQDTVDECTAAIQTAQDAQRTTAADEQKLADAENKLSATLAEAASAAAKANPEPSAPSSSSGKSSTGSKPSTSAGSSSGSKSSSSAKTSTPASAEQLAADQAEIDADTAQIAVAQQNLAAATLVSPITGTVGSIGYTTGQQASTSQNIVVFGPGEDQVTTSVSDTQAGQIKPGQQVTVTPDGSPTPLTGQVTAIGLLASTTSSGSPSYPVTISLPASQTLHPGATASVSIITSTAEAAVTVPTSAVHLQGANAFVTTVSGDKTETTRIKVGVSGAAVTEVLSGLQAGQQVLLADLGQALPTSNTNARGLVGGGQRPAGGAQGAQGAQGGR